MSKRGAGKSAKPVKKPASVGVLVPGKNGGQIWRGPAINHVPGTGRPPSEIRAAMRQVLDEDVMADLTQKYVAQEIDALGFANFLAKYGLGEKNETTLVSPEVTDRLQKTVNLISKQAPQLLNDLEAIWK